jgi:phenylacetic acid degradation operon negative regulatory protein
MTLGSSAEQTPPWHDLRVPTMEDNVSTRTFVLGMVHDDGRIIADELYSVGDAGGLTVHQIRLCLARLVSEGSFTQSGRGRKAVLELTAAGRMELEPEPEFVRLAFDQDGGLAPWDGTWHLVTFAIGEDRRSERNTLREQLVRMGAPLGGGVYVCANDWDDLVLDIANDLGVGDCVSLAVAGHLRVGRETDPKRIAKRLWAIDDIGARWLAFTRTHRSTVSHLAAATAKLPAEQLPSLLAGAIGLVAAFDSCMRSDPLLPPELLPKDWPGVAARRLLLHAAKLISDLRHQTNLPALFSQYDDVIQHAAQLQSSPSSAQS